MTRIATIIALLLLSGCSGSFSQPGRVPSYRQPFVTAPANSTYEPPGSLPP